VSACHDFEGLDAEIAVTMIADLKAKLPALAGMPVAGTTVALADDFSYTDPVDGSVSANQGIRILLQDGSRIVCRLSGTGTEGATLRLYYEKPCADIDLPVDRVLDALRRAALSILQLPERTGRTDPDVIT
jgi:phosphoglucomutase